MKSILQKDTSRCFICEENPSGDPLDKHHIFGGACRNKSEKYGLFVFLHHNKCHIFGRNSAYKNIDVRRKLEEMGQKRAMEVFGWTEREFRRIFYRSYL